ncbi:AMP-binding protein [Enterovirga sp. CN4-39]
MPARSICVVRDLLLRWDAEKPEAVFIVCEDCAEVTFAELLRRTSRVAHGLRRLGVARGDNVVVWMPNSVDCVLAWFAINALGAVYVPINTAYMGQSLAYVLRNAQGRVMVAHAELVGRLESIETGTLATIVSTGASLKGGIEGLEIVGWDEAFGEAVPDELPELDQPIEPWDVQSIVYTSGTTGPSKGVVSTYAHLYHMSAPHAFTMVDATDRYMCHLPLFHVGGTIPLMGMLSRGASVALMPSFSTGLFWDRVRATRPSVMVLLGVMATFLLKQPPSPRDRDHPLRKVIIIPLGAGADDFGRRFGVEVYTLYNMTEISTPLVSGRGVSTVGSCGQPREGVELRLVDANDCEVALGEVGELIVRCAAPWALCSGYFRKAEASLAAFRNGWFHTGDAFRVENGEWLFVDRLKDTIRRRGENISSFEVEAEVVLHPQVREVAAIPVPSDSTEDEVMCAVAPVAGERIDPTELYRFLEARMPPFMLPRYLRVMETLPKTDTQKIQKQVLRAAGVTADTWDREAAGIRARRVEIGKTPTAIG